MACVGVCVLVCVHTGVSTYRCEYTQVHWTGQVCVGVYVWVCLCICVFCLCCSDWFKLFVNSKFTEPFHFTVNDKQSFEYYCY